jgi:hypothetical protein
VSARTAKLLSALLLWATPGAAQTGTPTMPRIRALDDRAAAAVETGARRSPTFRALAEELERSDVVVYVYTTPRLSEHVSGGLSFVGVSATMRFLKIALDLDLTPDQAVYILAHELQHALEIARAPHVKTRDDFETFYRHIDVGGALAHTFETAEARRMGQRVRRELRAEPGTITDPRR